MYLLSSDFRAIASSFCWLDYSTLLFNCPYCRKFLFKLPSISRWNNPLIRSPLILTSFQRDIHPCNPFTENRETLQGFHESLFSELLLRLDLKTPGPALRRFWGHLFGGDFQKGRKTKKRILGTLAYTQILTFMVYLCCMNGWFLWEMWVYIYTYIINHTLSVRTAMQYPGSPMVFHRKVTSSFSVHFPATVYCFSFWIYLMIYKVLYIAGGFSPEICPQPYVKLPQQSASSSRREISSFSLDVVKWWQDPCFGSCFFTSTWKA